MVKLNTITSRFGILLIILAIGSDLYSQKSSHSKTIQYSSTNGGTAYCWKTISDNKGNIYSTGYFYRTIDFDPGVGTVLLTSSVSHDAYISKHDKNGGLVWVKQFTGSNTSHGYSIVLDDSLNVYSTGYFQGNADFDPSTASFILNTKANSTPDIYVSKLDSNGQFVWAKQMGGLGNDLAWTITRGSTGNLFIGGWFEGVADFDPSSSNLNLRSNGGKDAFICSLTSNGLVNWAKSFGGSSHDEVHSIVVLDSLVFSTGAIRDTVDFDPDTSTHIVISQGYSEGFLHIIDTSGAFKGVSVISGIGQNGGYDLAKDNSGNILTTGFFSSTASFGDSSNQTPITSMGRFDSYISKYDRSGGLIWAKSIGGSSDVRGHSVATDNLNNVYTLGTFAGNVDFDPDTSLSHFVNATTKNVFITRFDSNGKFQFVSPFKGDQSESYSVEVNPFNEILANGFFYGTTDFDPDTGKHELKAKGYLNGFITILSQCEFTDTNYSKIVCDSIRSPSSKYVWSKSGVYKDTLINYSGCDSVITINLTVLHSTRDTTSSSSCDLYTSPSGKNWSTSGTYLDTVSTSKGCDSLLVIKLTIKQSLLDTVYLKGCDSIRSPSGKYVWTFNGVFQDTMSAKNGCDSILVAFLDLGSTKVSNIKDTSCSELVSPSGKYIWTSTGVYFDTLFTAKGCDSVLKYDLVIPNRSLSVKDSSGFLVALGSHNTFQWYECKEQFTKLNGENSRLYKYKNSGEFIVEATQYSCFDTSDCLEVSVSSALTFENDFSLKLFPNPVKDYLIVESTEEIHSVEILTLSGVSIYTKVVNNKKIDLETGNFPSQLLFLIVTFENGQTQSFKISKQ